MQQGDAKQRSGESTDAAQLYAAAYRAMDEQLRTTPLAEHVVMSAAKEYQQAFLNSGDITLLESSREVLEAFRRDRERAGADPLPRVQAEIDRLSSVIENVRRTTRSDAATTADEDAELEEDFDHDRSEDDSPEPLDPVDDGRLSDDGPPRTPRRGKPDTAGIVLMTSGGVLAVTGAALLGVGARLGPAARSNRDALLMDEQYMALTLEQQQDYEAGLDEYVDRERRRGTAFLASGGVILVAGAAILVAGAVRFSRARRKQAHARFSPWWGGGLVGVSLSGRM